MAHKTVTSANLHTQPENQPYTLPLGEGMTHYIARTGGKLVISANLAQLLEARPELATNPRPEQLSHFLQHSLIPYPNTIYSDVWAVGVGDCIVFNNGATPYLSNTMPYLPENHLPTSQPASPQTLKKLLTASIEEKLPAKAEACFMLSSGKDSVGIALALANSSRAANVTAITYDEGKANSEADIAASIARKAGFKHVVVNLPKDTAEVRAAMTQFFTNSAQPVSDPVAPAYIMASHRAGISNQYLMDGTGNDLYMGILPPKKQKWYRYAPGACNAADLLQNLIPFHSPYNKFIRPVSDGPILGRLALRQPETKQFLPTHQTNPFWRKASANPLLKSDYQRLFQHMRAYYYDGAHTTRVREEIANAGVNTLVLPYSHPALYEYFRQLPVEAKYDAAKGRNKLLLRQLLLEDLGYDADKVGKRIFSFNQGEFLLDHRKFVEEEILNCKLWNKPDIEPLVRKVYSILPTTQTARYGLMQLFLLAGWHNHSRFLKKGR